MHLAGLLLGFFPIRLDAQAVTPELPIGKASPRPKCSRPDLGSGLRSFAHDAVTGKARH